MKWVKPKWPIDQSAALTLNFRKLGDTKLSDLPGGSCDGINADVVIRASCHLIMILMRSL